MDVSKYAGEASGLRGRWGWKTRLMGLGFIIMGGTVFQALGGQAQRPFVEIIGGISVVLGLALLLGWKGIKLVLKELLSAAAKQPSVKF